MSTGLLPIGEVVHPALRDRFQTHRVALCAHVFGSSVALLLGPWPFAARWRANRPAGHRRPGGCTSATAWASGGLAGLALSLRAFGGPVARVGFGALALGWLATGFVAWRAIRRGERAIHQRWMRGNFALTRAAVTLRLWLPVLGIVGLPFEAAHPVVAWRCWVPNRLFAEAGLRRAATCAAGAGQAAATGSG